MEDKVLIFICFILIAWLFYNQAKVNESMADVVNLDQIKEAVKQVYLADVEAIRNLSNVATQLQAGGLTVPGNLTVKGELVTESGNFKLGNIGKDQWIFHAPPDERGGLWISRIQRDGNINWDNGLNMLTSADGTQNIGGNFNLIPKGTIVAWSGATAPAGWTLCDGNNGTPDLRGRFIRMASTNLPQEDGATKGFADFVVGRKSKPGKADASMIGNSRGDANSWIFKMDIGDFGGTDHHVLSVNEMPQHAHGYLDTFWMEHNGWDRTYPGAPTKQQGANGNDGDNFPLVYGRATDPVGNGWGHNNMPPYYVLAYIMKL